MSIIIIPPDFLAPLSPSICVYRVCFPLDEQPILRETILHGGNWMFARFQTLLLVENFLFNRFTVTTCHVIAYLF